MRPNLRPRPPVTDMENINWAALCYDAVILAVVLGMINRGTKTGFTRSFIRTAGYALSAATAVVVSRIGSVLVYHSFMEPKFVEMIEGSINSTGSAGGMLTDLKEALASLPAISFVLFDLADTADGALEKIADQSAETIAGAVVNEVVSPVVYPILRSLIFAAVFLLGCFIVRAVAKGSGAVRRIPVVGTMDRFLGGLFGVVEGLIVAAVICVFVYVCLSLWDGRWSWFSRSVISESYIFKWIYSLVTGDSLV